MNDTPSLFQRHPRLILAGIAGLAAAASIAVLALCHSVTLHKAEARQGETRVVPLSEQTISPAIWGKDYPRQYDGYCRTADNYGIQGSSPRSVNAPGGRQAEDSRLLDIFAGYDAARTLYQARSASLNKHPALCIECHDPANLQLRITKADFLQGMTKLARSDEPVPCLPSIDRWRGGGRKRDYDPNTDASQQELCSLVCAQCHVTFSSAPGTKPFFAWDKGLKVEQIEASYDSIRFPDGHRFFDFKHAQTGAELLKAQHTEFELWSQGVHARSGVSCADCHMPYVREGSIKISDHNLRSPLQDAFHSCQTCHRFPESELKGRVETIQNRNNELLDRAKEACVQLIRELERARAGNVSPDALKPVYELQRQAQWRLDFIDAEGSQGFHAPQESARILAESIDYGRQGQLALREIRVSVAP
jgi:nitrite reductase (cytochrome c-552)